MKKSKTLLSAVASTLVVAAPVFSLASCSQSKTLLQQLEETMIYEFKELCKIPHASDKLLYEVPYKSQVMNLSNYLQKKIEKIINDKVWQDKWGNLWFDVKYNDEKLKDAPIVGIQAHMDMVFAFDSNKYEPGHYPDPKTTPIDVVEDMEDGQRILHSRDWKTSIGADNGVGVAQILTIISNPNVKHGNLRCIITNCEENAMQGAKLMIEGHTTDEATPRVFEASNPHVLDDVKYMLCLDAEHEGLLFTACSGGVGAHYDKEYSVENAPANYKYKLTVDGFLGGHSGAVPALHFGNALSIANEIIAKIKLLGGGNNIQLASISTPGTLAYNSVVQKCVIEFCSTQEITANTFDSIKETVYGEHDPSYLSEIPEWQQFVDMDTDLWTLEKASFTKVLSVENTNKILALHDGIGYGVETWTPLWEEGYNKTSRNIGPSTLTIENNKAKFNLSSYGRSDKEEKIYGPTGYKETWKKLASDNGVNFLCDAQFHPWIPDPNKRDLLDQVVAAWKNTGIETLEYRVHAGLEPSWWMIAMKEKSGEANAQAVTYGPSITDCHKPTEKIYLDSLEHCLQTTMYILENIK